MKTKGCRIRICFIAFSVIPALLFSFVPSFVFGSYNDAWVLEYENITCPDPEQTYVPTLFKNDSSFGNHRRFPLVVQNNTHYVPIELFLGINDVTLTYGYSTSYFYLARENGTRYISFDIDNDLVTTHGMKTYTLETKLFYDTRYIPALDVADVLGITVDIYDNPDDGVYALRLSDKKAKLSFSELIKIYSPIKKDESSTDTPDVVEPPDVPDDNNPPDGGQTEEPVVPDIGYRSIYLSIDLSAFGNVTDILNVLERDYSDNACTFFITPENILQHPDEVRQIIACGQNIGFILPSDADENSLSQTLSDARENLELVAKCSSRLVRFSSGSRRVGMTDEEFDEFVRREGICVWDYNISVGDSRNMYDNIYNSLYNLSRTRGTNNAYIRITPGRNTAAALEGIAELVKVKTQLDIVLHSETTIPFTAR